MRVAPRAYQEGKKGEKRATRTSADRFVRKSVCTGAKSDAMMAGSAENEATRTPSAGYGKGSRKKSKIIDRGFKSRHIIRGSAKNEATGRKGKLRERKQKKVNNYLKRLQKPVYNLKLS